MSTVGIDLGIHKIALFDTAAGSEAGWSYTATSNTRDQQLAELAYMAHDFCLLQEADSVWIEDVLIGNNRKYSIQLAQTLGAVLSDLSHLRGAQGLDIRLVNTQAWKKAVVGSGHATKEEVRSFITSTHPQYAPLCGEDEDLYDACCVGLYGELVTTRAEHLQL